uniref:Uncharacterized protein n=1 Tax=Arion vulgaris TaxID=1028688 RepID=A0A0B7AJ48_9EUPU
MDSAKRISRRSKRKLAISSDSDDDVKTAETNIKTRRQSSRIYDKQHKADFRLPSRDEIWKDIPSLTSIPKIKTLTPRKTVNNFTKVYNDYNYDDYEDTSDDDTSSVESSDDENKKEKQHRIKNYHKRLQVQTSSSDEDDSTLDKCNKICVDISGITPKKQDKKDTAKRTDEQGSEHNCDNMKNILDSNHTIPIENDDLGDSDESEVLSPCKRNSHLRNRSVLESDDDDDNTKNDIDDNNDQENTDISGSSDSDDPSVESSRSTLANRKLKTIDMFKQFRDLQAKKKKSVSST